MRILNTIITICLCMMYQNIFTQDQNYIPAHFSKTTISINLERDIYAGLKPKVGIVFHYMGSKNIDTSAIEIMLKEQVISDLNKDLENKINFFLESISHYTWHMYLPDIYKSLDSSSESSSESLLKPEKRSLKIIDFIQRTKKKKNINVYVFETYPSDQVVLLGFCILHKDYDVILMSHDGFRGNTLTHEVGHFLKLKHPWETTKRDLQKLGLDNKENCNHMNYDCDEHQAFTSQQLNFMKYILIKKMGHLWRN